MSDTYEEYIASYHGMKPALSPKDWAEREIARIVQPVLELKNDRTNPKDLIGITKIPLRFIPPSSLAFLARVMELGAHKYGPMNWRKNDVKATIYYEAALRHIWAALDGEELDPESNQPHAAHAMACMAILLDANATGNMIDDRFAPGAFGKLVSEMIKSKEKPNG